MNTETCGPVLVLYTGGTIGGFPSDPNDTMSPLVPAPIERVLAHLPNYTPATGVVRIDRRDVRIDVFGWETPIDSSNVAIDDWVRLARIIRDRYDDYEGFVILNGTDTMAYTASALAFLLEGLNKPVVLTGSQRPIAEPRSDAVQNVTTAIEIAAARNLGGTVVPEVCVFFRDGLYRGCRTTKVNAGSFSAFDSPNFPPIGKAGGRIYIRKGLLRETLGRPLRINESVERGIASISLFPGMDARLLDNLLHTSGLRGVVLQTFGAGNAPTDPEFLEAVESAVKRGILILGVTQCWSGEVELGLYDVSASLLSRGVLSGLDLTPEAALAKMIVTLGREKRIDVAADMLQINLRGEQRQSAGSFHSDL